MSQLKGTSRRDALKRIAMGTGAVTTLPILGQGPAPQPKEHAAHSSSAGHSSLEPDPNWKPLFFDQHQDETLIALTDLIIPETDSPGAKAALVNRYIDQVLNEENPSRQRAFIEGLAWIDARSLELHGKPFIQTSADQQTALLTPLADPLNGNPEDHSGTVFFKELKNLTVFAYYTSKIGMEQELGYTGDDYHTEYPGTCTHPEH